MRLVIASHMTLRSHSPRTYVRVAIRSSRGLGQRAGSALMLRLIECVFGPANRWFSLVAQRPFSSCTFPTIRRSPIQRAIRRKRSLLHRPAVVAVRESEATKIASSMRR